MSKYVISKEVYTSIVKAAEKAKKFFANLSEEDKVTLAERIFAAADNENRSGWVDNSVPLVFVENEKNEDGTAVGLRPMTAAEILKVGPDAIRADGSAIVAFIRDDWKLPRFSHDDKEGWQAAAILNQKGFKKPYLVRTEVWNKYYEPIRSMIQEEGTRRDELAELVEKGAPEKEVEDLKKVIKDMADARLAQNCLKFGTFEYWYNRRGGDYPFVITFPEGANSFDEAFANSVLGLRACEFSAWKEKFKDRMLERAKEAGDTYRDVTDVEEANRRMEVWLEEHKTLKAEEEKVRRNGKTFVDAATGKVVTIGGMSQEEVLIEAFKNEMNRTIRFYENVFGFTFLNEENEKGSDHHGWGEIVSSGYLPSDYKAKQAILCDRSRWKEFVPTQSGKPATIWSVFYKTGYLVGEGLPLRLYLAMTGASLKEWKNFVNAPRKQEERKAENAGAFDAWKALLEANKGKKKAAAAKAKADAIRLADAPF